MRSLKFTLFLLVSLMISLPAAQAVVRVSPVQTENSNTSTAAENRKMSKKQLREARKEARKERRMKRKAMRQEIKQAIRSWKKENASDTDTLLLVIIAILLPPLAMAIYDGISNRFWISLLLTLLFYLPGLIYTLVVILGER